MKLWRTGSALLILAATGVCSGCASAPKTSAVPQTPTAPPTETTATTSAALAAKGERDPIEPVNRTIYAFNDKADRWVIRPIAHGYMKITPAPVRKGIGHFFANLAMINTIPNDALQGKLKQGAKDVGRFALNTTVGVAGIFDVAEKVGLPDHQEDLGQTLAVWGVGEGPYVMLPLGGPSTARDVPGVLMSMLLNRTFFAPLAGSLAAPINTVGAVDKRAEADVELQKLNEMAIDPYVFMREGYRQHREFLANDGVPAKNADPFADLNEAIDDAAAPGATTGAAVPAVGAKAPDAVTKSGG